MTDEPNETADLLDDNDPEQILNIGEQHEEKLTVSADSQPENSGAIDVAALGAALGASLKPTIEGLRPQEAPKTYTEEELDAKYNRWKPTKEWLTKLDNLETREAAIKEQHRAQLKEFDTIVQLRQSIMEAKLEEKYAPLLAEQQRQAEERAYSTFNKAYPQLADPALRPFINTVAEQLKNEGFKETGNKFLDVVATRLATALKSSNPNFTLTPRASASGASSNGKRSSNPNAVRSNSFGGGGGNSSGSQTIEGGSVKAIADLFGGPK